jgi:hypothetical protein
VANVKNVYNISSESLKGTDHLEHLGVDGRITLIWIVKKRVGGLIAYA